ncbi:MAG: hypothetical protein J6L91_06060 [Clostridia bacterium]|nr:hypothetical protein [Clostridia bacterium]
MSNKNLSLRINENLLHKLHILSDYEMRSVNSEILILIREAVEKFENEHGKVEHLTDIDKFRQL